MGSAGFAPYRYEWWHWSYGDDVWAEFVGADNVLFELIERV
jgi:D-alanyl-D-alanine dipeptidase